MRLALLLVSSVLVSCASGEDDTTSTTSGNPTTSSASGGSGGVGAGGAAGVGGLGGEGGKASDSGQQTDVACAAASCLVVWAQGSALVGARVDAAGTVLDSSSIALTGSVLEPPMSAGFVASDGTDFLVVWKGTAGVMATRIAASGAVLDPQGILLSDHAGSRFVKVTRGNGHYIVAWLETVQNTPLAYATRIDSEGVVLDALPVPVGQSVDEDMFLDLAIGFGDDTAVLLWPGHQDLYGARLSNAGEPLDPQTLALNQSVAGQPLYAPRTVSVLFDGSSFLALASVVSPRGNLHLVAAHLDHDLALIDAPTPLVNGADFDCFGRGALVGPSVLVAWAQSTGEVSAIHGGLLPAGQPLVPPTALDLTAPPAQPSLLYGGHSIAQFGQQFLVSLDVCTGRAESLDCTPFASRVNAAGVLLDPQGIVLTP